MKTIWFATSVQKQVISIKRRLFSKTFVLYNSKAPRRNDPYGKNDEARPNSDMCYPDTT